MRLSHVNISMPAGSEDLARAFYTGLLGLPEIPKPESLRVRAAFGLTPAATTCIYPSKRDGRKKTLNVTLVWSATTWTACGAD